ncbi:MAG TPA: hypothetical protein PKO15_19145 [Fibrobacteria bacterium]|nr:hypothetical protein [Fibrobacteria bacterium]HOX51970.1 hypothetical protein [Fibrobacteria bacterium]
MGILIKCPLCGQGFNDGRAHVGTSDVVFPPGHFLYEYCDTGLHIDCLERWEHRLEFAKGYFDLYRTNFATRGTLLHEAFDWILGCGRAPLADDPFYVEVDLLEWPVRLHTPWEHWETFLESDFEKGLDRGALEKARVAIKEVRKVVPTLSSLRELRRVCLERHGHN